VLRLDLAETALEVFSESRRLELAPPGITVSVVSPRQTGTPILDKIDKARASLQEPSSQAAPACRDLVAPRARMAERRGAPPSRVAEAVARSGAPGPWAGQAP